MPKGQSKIGAAEESDFESEVRSDFPDSWESSDEGLDSDLYAPF